MTTAAPIAPAFAGLCLDCNYPLMDVPPHRCAECGRAFDPTDRQTVNTGRPVPAYARWAVGPISWPVYAVALFGCGATLWRARLPIQPFSWSAPVLWGWLGLAAIWLAWPLVRLGVLHHYGWPRRVIRPMGRWHWVVPLLIVATVAVAAERLPPRAAFALSRPDMDRLARFVMDHPDDAYPPQRVGLFWANHIASIHAGAVTFVVDDARRPHPHRLRLRPEPTTREGTPRRRCRSGQRPPLHLPGRRLVELEARCLTETEHRHLQICRC